VVHFVVMYALIALMQIMMRTKSDIEKAYKPNGITDNRNEWRLKNIKRKHPYTFWARMFGLRKLEQRIAEPHDITKSNFGYE